MTKHSSPGRHLRALVISLICTATPLIAITADDVAALRDKATKGNAIAQYNLGLAYADTAQTFTDFPEAYVWLNLAADNGATGRALERLTEQMTPAQLTEGKRRLADARAKLPAPAAPSAGLLVTPAPLTAAETPAMVALEQDKQQLSKELAAAWKETEQLKTTLGAQLSDVKKRLAIAETALANKDRQIASLETAAQSGSVSSQLQSERDTALAAAASAKNAAESAAADLKALQTRIDELTASNATLESRLQTARESATATAKDTERLAQLGKDNEALRIEALTLRDQNAALKSQLDAAATSTPAAAAETTPVVDEAHAAQLADLQTKLDASIRAFRVQQTDVDRTQKALVATEAERAALAEKLATTSHDLEQTKTDLATANSRAENAESRLAAVGQTNTGLQSDVSRLSGQSTDQAAQIQQLTAENNSLRSTYEQNAAELVQVREELRQTRANVMRLALENREFRTRLALSSGPATGTPGRSQPATTATTPAPSVIETPPAPSPAAAEPVAVAPAQRFHVVVSGDTLSGISKQYYGTANRWQQILEANRDVISSPSALAIGMRLRIP